jgi:acyl-CoA synthetase (AMP-forming)/AMP-acid ligase II
MATELPVTLAAALERACRRFGSQPALIHGSRRLTYSELARDVAAVRRVYGRIGVAPGERVMVSASNRPEYMVAMIAAWSHGAVHVGVDYRYTGRELAEVAELTEAGTLVYEPSDTTNVLAQLETVRRRNPRLKIVVHSDHLLPAGYYRWRRTEGQLDVSPTVSGDSALAQDSPAMIFVTSGTTGTTKATVGFQRNLATRWARLAQWLRFGPEDVHLAQLPLTHGFGLMMAVAALLTGGRLVLLSRFSADAALDLIGAHGVTVLNGAPTHFRSILQRLNERRHDISTLRLSVGTAATFPPTLVNAIWKSLGVEFMCMYGSSEGVGVTTTDVADILCGSVGRPEPGSVAVVDADHRELSPDTIGEVAFSRAFFPVAYWGGHQTALADAQPGWYYCGDLGRLDAQGRLFVYGRLKHQIDRGGLKIDPVEVEAALLRCPGVVDVAVVGRPNPILGERVCACVTPADGHRPILTDLRAHLSRSLAPFKLPETIPRTPIGKVDLPKLRDVILAAGAGPARQS